MDDSLISVELRLATDLIDSRFEGNEQILSGADVNYTERLCGPDEHVQYAEGDVADFHINYVQHFERVRQHSNYIQLNAVQHEHEGYYECTVRLNDGRVGVRVFFLSGECDP